MRSLSDSLIESHLVELHDSFGVPSNPTPLEKPHFVAVNNRAAQQLNISFTKPNTIENLFILSGETIVPDTKPIATVYAGHQFGIYTSKLGDGRVHILGDILDAQGQRWELQLKGSGITPFSRTNNGRADLATCVREYLGGEALHGLGIPSTRALCIIGSEGLIKGAAQQTETLLVRFAKTHLRFGHFEYFHNQGDLESLKQLADYAVNEYYPELNIHTGAERYLQLLYSVTDKTANLIAQWQSVGFVHGVMNTDNMSMVGTTLDLGPYGFVENYSAGYSPNASDDQHRYALDQQPDIGRWNCLALAEALKQLLPKQSIPAGLIRRYRKIYEQVYFTAMCNKLGLFTLQENDTVLIETLLMHMEKHNIDYTNFFRMLSLYPDGERKLIVLFNHDAAFKHWLLMYKERLATEKLSHKYRTEHMLKINPKYILRRHLIDEAIELAETRKDYRRIRELLRLIQSPYVEHAAINRNETTPYSSAALDVAL